MSVGRTVVFMPQNFEDGFLTPLQRGLAGVCVDLDIVVNLTPLEKDILVCRLFIGLLFVLIDEIKRSGGGQDFITLFSNTVALENFLLNSESFRNIIHQLIPQADPGGFSKLYNLVCHDLVTSKFLVSEILNRSQMTLSGCEKMFANKANVICKHFLIFEWRFQEFGLSPFQGKGNSVVATCPALCKQLWKNKEFGRNSSFS